MLVLTRTMRASALSTFVFSLAVAHAAHAEEPNPSERQACVSAHETAQKSKNAGQLRAARTALTECARETCPRLISADCTQWIAELERLLPSVVVSARDAEGRDLTQVRVLVDGVVLTERLDGKALSVDPGEHRFRFEAPELKPIERKIVISEGERSRSVPVIFARASSTAVRRSPPRDQRDNRAERPKSAGSPSPLAYVLAGVGVVGVASFAYFGLRGRDKREELDSAECKPSCPSSEVDEARRDFLIADISLGVALVSFGIGGYLFLSPPSDGATQSSGKGFVIQLGGTL
jgi:hypothetical protein